MSNTIREWQAHFAAQYSARNAFVNGSFHERATHMQYRLARIAKSYRKKEKMPARLARATSYFMSCVNYFGSSLDLELGMMEKFPSFGCGYCRHHPCDCPEDRLDPEGFSLDESQRDWTVSQWQAHLKKMYGHYNMGDFPKVFMRASEEFGEFGILVAAGPGTPIRPSARIVQCRQEAADCFSWLLTMAYVEGVDLEGEVIQRYYRKCPGCQKPAPYDCPAVFISGDGNSFSTIGTPEYMAQNAAEETA